MKFSLHSQGDNIKGTATSGNISEQNEDGEMKNANLNIQMNLGNSGSLIIKNTLKLVGGLALAGMIAMTATFGSVSADSPLKTSNYLATGPNEMDVEYLNNLGRSFMVHGPNAMDTEYLNNLGSTCFVHGPDVVERSSLSAFRVHGPDVVEQNSLSAFRIHGPDVVEQNSAGTYFVHGPDAVEPSSASTYFVHGPDTSEWNG